MRRGARRQRQPPRDHRGRSRRGIALPRSHAAPDVCGTVLARHACARVTRFRPVHVERQRLSTDSPCSRASGSADASMTARVAAGKSSSGAAAARASERSDSQAGSDRRGSRILQAPCNRGGRAGRHSRLRRLASRGQRARTLGHGRHNGSAHACRGRSARGRRPERGRGVRHQAAVRAAGSGDPGRQSSSH